MAESIPYIATSTGDASAAPDGAIPIDLFGAGGGEPGPVAFGDLTGVPAALTAAQAAGTASIRAIGTTATTAAAGNHTQAATTVTVAAGEGIVGANAQLVLANLAARIVALEAATP